MIKKEVRFIPQEMRVKADEGESKKIVGYAAKFHSPRMWGSGNRLRPGAFAIAEKVKKVTSLGAFPTRSEPYILGRNNLPGQLH